MASDRQSPVMVEQSSPTHTFSSPDFALSILSPSLSNQRTSAHTSTSTSSSTLPISDAHDQQSHAQTTETNGEVTANRPITESVHTPDHEDGGDDSSHSDSASNSSASTETPGTASTPRSAEQDSSEHPSGLEAARIPDAQSTEQTPPIPAADTNDTTENPPTTNTEPPAQNSEPPIPPVENPQPAIDDIPEWVKYEEDTSKPSEEELKDIENSKTELNASDFAAIERDVFAKVDDPDLRPHKKIRLSWVVKGVRGTKEKPNRVRIMTSPAVQVDGMYWNIKFFPRGNKSRNSLSAYLRCSRQPPEPSKCHYEGTFKCFEGGPDANFSKCEPLLDLEINTLDVKNDEPTPAPAETKDSADKGENTEPIPIQPQDDNDDDSVSGDERGTSDGIVKTTIDDDFRVSAQLGLAIYNPDEPRTCFTCSASHQFYPHQDDWGWDTAVSHWEDIHRRKRGQRQALLRNDTLAIDAYIRIYDDPTKALFWHSSPGESQWDAKGLAGFFPFGTRMLYHSPATAGIASWMLLAPFRSLIQGIDAGTWRKDSASRPRSLIAQLQLALFQMRYMKKEELYVHIDNIIHEITRCQESFDNVTTFWEAFRRSIELEVNEDPTVSGPLTKMFGSRGTAQKLPLLPVEKVANFQEGVKQGFAKAGFKGPLPDFLPLTLQRQSFDPVKREWRLHRDRVGISEEIDMSDFCTDEDCKFTLYGLVIHEAERTSGKFHSILRPAGPGGKWLAFTDGNGNKIKSYTRKQVEEYELPDDSAVKKSNEAPRMFYMGLYIRTSQLSQYLPTELEPFHLAAWLKPFLEESYYHNPDLFEPAEPSDKADPIQIELFWDKLVGGQEGKLDLYRLKSTEKARQKNYRQIFTVDRDATISDVKVKLASALGVPDKAFKLWSMNYYRLGAVSKAYMYVFAGDSVLATCLGSFQVLTMWLSILPDKFELADDILVENFLKLEGIHIEAPPKPEPVKGTENASTTSSVSNTESPSSSLPEIAVQANGVAHSNENHSEESGQNAPETIPETTPDTITIGTNTDNSINSGQQASQHPNEQDTEALRSAIADEVSQQSSRNALEVDRSPAPEASQSQEPSSLAISVDTSTNTVSQSLPDGTNNVTETASTDINVAPPAHSGIAPENAPAPINSNATNEPHASTAGGSATILVGDIHANEDLSPVVHGHLFEATSHNDTQLSLGIPVTIGSEQIIIVPSGHEDLSAADAELISRMIAEDLEASEQHAIDDDGREDDGESAAEDEEADSRPSTPRPAIADIYGFLHVFDAVQQKFTAKGTFNVPRDTVISTMVKKQLGFDDNHAFQLWKRDGTFRTTGVSLESSFVDVSLTDCCEVIVGDHIGEIKIEALKTEAKFVDPGQLMRHIAMVQRKHPVLAATTEGPVELADFGGDYYKGPLVNGQRHGKACSIVTQAGDSYDGPLLSGQKSGGKGRMTYQNGDVYDGEWLDDQKHGQGEFIEKRTGNRYVGGYENDKRWGKGVTYWEMADQQAALCQVCYFEEVDAVFYKCGHVVACYACAKQCATDSAGCPVCRKPVEAVVKMYRS